jgi:hypothetical protein
MSVFIATELIFLDTASTERLAGSVEEGPIPRMLLHRLAVFGRLNSPGFRIST